MLDINHLKLFQLTIKRNFKFRHAVAIQLIGILLIILLSQLFANYIADHNDRQRIKLGLIVNDDHQYVNLLLNNFTANEDFTALFDIAVADYRATTASFERGDLDAYVIIPKSFTENLLYYRDNSINIYTHFGFPTKTKVLKSLFSAYSHYVQTANITTLSFYDLLTKSNLSESDIRNANNQFSIEIISTTIGRNDLFDVKVQNELDGVSTNSYFIVALSFAIMGFATIPIAATNYDDMQNCVTGRLLVSGQPIPVYLASLHFGNVFATLLQTASFAIIWAIGSGLNPISLLIGFILMALFWSIIWLSLVMALKNRQLFFVSSIIVGFVMALLGGSLTPYTIMPLHLKLLSHYSPILALSKISLEIATDWRQLTAWLLLSAMLLSHQYFTIATRQYGEK